MHPGMKKASVACLVLAVLLSDVMCGVVGFAYRDMLCGIEHSSYSAPASVAFLYAVPFLVVILGCLIAAYLLYRKS